MLKRRKFVSAAHKRMAVEHDAFLRKILGGRPVTRRTDTFDEPKSFVRQPKLPPVSNNLGTGGGYKRSVDDHKWKRDREEKPETVRAIEAKKKQVAPAFSKGAYQFIPSTSDVRTLGRKI